MSFVACGERSCKFLVPCVSSTGLVLAAAGNSQLCPLDEGSGLSL